MKKIIASLTLLALPFLIYGQSHRKERLYIELNVINAHVNGVVPEGLSYGGALTLNYLVKDNIEFSVIGFRPIPSTSLDGRYAAHYQKKSFHDDLKLKKYMPMEYNCTYYPLQHKRLEPLFGKKKISEGKSKKGFFSEAKNLGVRVGATYHASTIEQAHTFDIDYPEGSVLNGDTLLTATTVSESNWISAAYSYTGYLGVSYSPTHRNYTSLYEMGDDNKVDKYLFKMFLDVLYSPYTYIYYHNASYTMYGEMNGAKDVVNKLGFRAGIQLIPHSYKFKAQDKMFRKYFSYNFKLEAGYRPGVKKNGLYAAGTVGLILSERTTMMFKKKNKRTSIIQGDTSGRTERNAKQYKKEHEEHQSEKAGSNSKTNTKKKRKKGQKELKKAKKKANK